MKVSSIEEGYPIPPSIPRNNKYNLHLMKVGQCFTVEEWDSTGIQRIRVAVSNYAKRNNKKFVTRKIIEENGDWKLRVWREA
jgi:hypothetical protein|tara:strand:+ start:1384 stop:1629 length:246 start_codon:yes stop_codon:yes gene_type:complete